ncbi:TPA: hypothetical protein PIT84_001325 [Klebsiella quasipneumoniae subsp. similipneumoniae]|nr:hypothetical protein [Klebsiella quasipneumoniae subsp. similipneumoniae]
MEHIKKYIIPKEENYLSFLDSSKNEVVLREPDFFKSYGDSIGYAENSRWNLLFLDNHIGSNQLSQGVKKNNFLDSNASEREKKLSIGMLIDLLKSEDYVEGEITKCQLFLESLYEKDENLFGEVFQNVWLSLYSNSYELRKYLCVASSLEYEILKDKADVLILGGASHKDPLVNEAALRAAEAWSDPKFLIYLHELREFEFEWLNDYKKSVIEYLEHLK